MPISYKEGSSRNDKHHLSSFHATLLWQALMSAAKYFRYLQTWIRLHSPLS